MYNQYNPKSVRASLIAKYFPDLSKTYMAVKSLEEVAKRIKDFGFESINFSLDNDSEKGLVQKLVFDCKNTVLKKGILNAYVGMSEIDTEKNPRTKPNMSFDPIFENFHEFVDKVKTEFILETSERAAWDNQDEIDFVKKWHRKGKSKKQITKAYMGFCEGGDFCDGIVPTFTDRTEIAIKNYVDRCYEDGTLKPHRINWEKQEVLASSAIWIAYLERSIRYMGFVQRTQKVLNDYHFDGDVRIGTRSLECFLKRNKDSVEKVS